ncbi:MAG TPA: hypothetical protein PLA77_05695, partial [Bacteroidales bacterium]|nr:hypothetical protein [Bacteroidales bacterium]
RSQTYALASLKSFNRTTVILFRIMHKIMATKFINNRHIRFIPDFSVVNWRIHQFYMYLYGLYGLAVQLSSK